MEQYYGTEDEIETPETQLDNLRAQAGAIQAVDVWSVEQLSTVYDKTLEMWNAAAERGDVETQNGLNEIYKGAEHMQQTLTHTNAAMRSVLEAAQALAKQKQAIEQELGELVEAVESADFSNPHISEMAEMIETDLYEMISENGLYDEGMSEDLYDNVISEMVEVVRKSAPKTTYAIVERLFHLLIGDWELNDIQRGLLISLVNTVSLDDHS